VLRCRSPFRSPPFKLIHRTLTQMRCRTVGRRSPSLIPDSVGVDHDHPCCRKPHGSLRNFWLTGTIFLSIPSHFARIRSSRSQYFTSSNHRLCGFYLNFLLKAREPHERADKIAGRYSASCSPGHHWQHPIWRSMW